MLHRGFLSIRRRGDYRALRRLLPLLAFSACCLIWGSTWLFIKLGYESMPPLTAAALRFAIAAAVLFPLQGALRLPGPRGRREWGVVAVVGVVLVGLDYGLIYWGEQLLPSGLTAVLFSTNSLLTALLARAAGIERLTPRKVLGTLLAIGGLVLLFSDSFDLRGAALLPMAAIVAAAFCSAATNVTVKKHGASIHPVTLNAPSAAIGALLLGAGALARGEEIALPRSAAGWGVLLYLSLFGSVVAFLLFFWLLRRWSSTDAALISVLTPLLAVLLGVVFHGESVTPRLAGGSALVLVGVAVASGARWRPTVPEARGTG